jgi:hypothetical protein
LHRVTTRQTVEKLRAGPFNLSAVSLVGIGRECVEEACEQG